MKPAVLDLMWHKRAVDQEGLESFPDVRMSRERVTSRVRACAGVLRPRQDCGFPLSFGFYSGASHHTKVMVESPHNLTWFRWFITRI